MRHRIVPVLMIAVALALVGCSAAAGTPAGGDGGGGNGAGTGVGTGSSGGGGTSGGGAVATPTSAGGGGGGSTGGGSTVVQDPCTLLTPDEIKAQFGVEVAQTGPSGASTGATSPECTWQPTAFTQALAGVSLTIQQFDQGFFDMTRGSQSSHVDVAGVGDAAFFWTPANPFVLDIKKGDREIILWVAAGGLADQPDKAEKLVVNLANDILGRL